MTNEININLEQLAQRAVACKPWQWMPGMLTMCRVHVIEGGYDYLIGYRQGATRDGGGLVDTEDAVGFLPDLTDHATLGCLLALVREAWGSPAIVTMPMANANWGVAIPTVLRDGTRFRNSSEAEALVAALEAAP